MNRRLRGLYAITCHGTCGDKLFRQVESALWGGVHIIQYRDKGTDEARRREEAAGLAALCRSHYALFIVNDDIGLARRVGADGVHLGREDGTLAVARETLGPDAIIGLSCYNDLQRAGEAEAAGADYVAFGRFFPSSTKPLAVQADAELLRRARRALTLPIVAIGGITPENGAPLVQAGADMLAVIQGVFGQPDIQDSCRKFTQLFEDSTL